MRPLATALLQSDLEPEEIAQALGLCAADRNFGLPFVVHTKNRSRITLAKPYPSYVSAP